jgi:hypothetical protein
MPGKNDPQAGVYSEKLNALTPEIAKGCSIN